MQALTFTFFPLLAVLAGAVAAVLRPPGPALASTIQHLAAGVVFAAAAAEILPQVIHDGSPTATLTDGTLGVVTLLSLKSLRESWARFRGPRAILNILVCFVRDRSNWPRGLLHRAMGVDTHG